MPRRFSSPLALQVALVTLVTLAIATVAIVEAASGQQFGGAKETGEKEGRLHNLVKSAREHGEAKVVLPTVLILPTGLSSVEEIFDDYSLVVAKLVDAVTTVDSSGDKIITWHKVRVSDWLARQKATSGDSYDGNIPQQLLPLSQDELIFYTDGGTLEIDGVTVEQGSPQSSHLRPDTPYLFILFLENPPGIASLAAEANGVFAISSEGTFSTLGNPEHDLVKDMRQRYGERLDFLREDTRRRTAR
jgi:hypothetical protein